MRLLLRVLAPLLGLVLAVVGLAVVVETVTLWVSPTSSPLIVPWPTWLTAAEGLTWQSGGRPRHRDHRRRHRPVRADPRARRPPPRRLPRRPGPRGHGDDVAALDRPGRRPRGAGPRRGRLGVGRGVGQEGHRQGRHPRPRRRACATPCATSSRRRWPACRSPGARASRCRSPPPRGSSEPPLACRRRPLRRRRPHPDHGPRPRPRRRVGARPAGRLRGVRELPRPAPGDRPDRSSSG